MEEGKLIMDAESKMTEIKLEERINNDFPCLSEEKFDFDLSLSPSSENEDEVFVGPMGHKEKCIAVSIEACDGAEGSNLPSSADNLLWSPVAEEKFAEIVKEAHLVALQLQSGGKTKRPHANQVEGQRHKSVEKFVQESKSKLKMVETGIKAERTPRAVRRETYCVWESPVCLLPPTFQKHSRQLEQVMDQSPQIPRQVSSPRTGKFPKSLIGQVAQGRVDKDDKKSSKLKPVKTSYVSGNSSSMVEQPERDGLHCPSGKKHLKSMGSLEDLLSSKSSIVPNTKDSSVVQDERSLLTPGKRSVKSTQLKPSNDVHLQRKTLSSSSSSLSSMNSSMNSNLSISPKRGKVKTNIFAKTSSCGSEVSSGTTKIAMVRPLRVSSVQASHSDTSGKQERSACAMKGNPSVNAAKNKAVIESKTSSSGIRGVHLDPRLQKSSQKSVMLERRGSSCSENKMVPSAKEDVSEIGAVRVLQPIAFLSCGNVGSNVAVSPPAKQLEERTVLNSCSSIKSIATPANIKRSGLPTPASRRMSGITARTPKTVPRSISSPHLLCVRQASSTLSKKTSAASSKNAEESNVKATYSSSTSSTEEDSFPTQAVSIALDFSPEKDPSHKQALTENKKTAEEIQAEEGLLIDIGIGTAPVAPPECESKPLIDFFNTPDMIKAVPLKLTQQLVDPGSPLIYLSPEGNKENLDSPLLKF